MNDFAYQVGILYLPFIVPFVVAYVKPTKIKMQ